MQETKRNNTDRRISIRSANSKENTEDQVIYLTKDPKTQIWSLVRTETDLYREPPDPVLEAVAKLVNVEHPEWTGTPSELVETANVGMAANALPNI